MADGPAAEIFAALDRLNPGRPFGVAVSGGSDSMALLTAACDWAGAAAVRAATVDHGLRAEAKDEAAAVGRFCAGHGIAHTILSLEPLSHGGNLSAALREGRYDALADWAQAAGVGTVLLGHTMDDQAETVLMRLARGSGAEGLSGMAEERTDRSVRWLRPMLGLRRAALRDWLAGQGIDWADDPTNEDPSFDRVTARTALATLSGLGINAEGLSATADRLRRQRAVLEEAAELLANRAALPAHGGEIRLNREILCTALPDTSMRVLAEALRRIGGHAYRPRFRSIDRLWARIAGGESFRATLAGCVIDTRAEPAEVRIGPEHPS